MKKMLSWMTFGSALGFLLLSSHVDAQIDQFRERTGDTRGRQTLSDPMNPPAKARLAATTLDGDIDDLLGMVGQLGGLGCAFEVDDPAENIICSDPDFSPCAPKQNIVGPNFYFVNGFDLTKGVVVYNAQTQEMYLGLRVVGYIGDVDGDLNPNTICPDGAASGIIENFGIGSTDGYRWDFDTDCSPSGAFGRDAWVEIRGPTDAVTGDPSIDITSNITYTTAEVMWAGNGGLDSTEIEVKLTGVDLLTNFPNGGFDVKVFAGSEEDCVGENKTDPGRCEPPVPALTATKTCVDVCAGDSTTCTIKVWNTGLVPIDVQVFDNIPTGHTYVSGSASGIGEPASAGSNDVLFTGPTLSPGDSLTFSFMVDTPEECFGDVTNFATASGTFSSACYQDDPDFRTTEYDFDDTYACLQNTSLLDIQDQTKCVGDNVTFTAVASGVNLSYQWYKGGTQGNPESGTLIQGATGSSYTINGVQESDESTYCVIVTGDCGTDWECASLTVDPPTVAEPFADQTKCPGEDVTFTVSASGLNLTYQWYKGGTQGNPGSGTLIQGATGNSYTINGVQEADEAAYCVLVTGSCGTDWECAMLTVDPPTVAEPFGDQTKCPGEDVTFTVSASGLDLTYQWYKGGTQGNPGSGTLIQGATGNSYTITGVQESDEAVYCVLVTGKCGTDWECGSLTVDPPTVAQPFDAQTKCEGEDVTFTASASGKNLTYQWYKGGTQGQSGSGTLIQGATNNAYTINGVQESDEAVYCVLVTGECGTAWQCAMLTVDPGTVADDIGDQTKCEGDNVTFTVNATGENLFYQWYKNGDPATSQSGTLLETENGSSLTLTNVMASDDAVYCVYVSGDCGSVWKCATLSVLGAKLEVTAVGDTVCAGFDGEAVFTIKNTSDHTTDFKVECSIGGQAMNAVEINGVPSGEMRTHTVTVPCEAASTVTVSCVVTATLPELDGCEAATDPIVATVYCLEPDVTIEKSTDPRITGDNSKVTIVVTNTGTSPLNPVRVSDHWPAGLTFDAGSLTSNCQVTAQVENGDTHTWLTFSDFSLDPQASCTIMFNVGCVERDNAARIDTAKVIAWCDGVDAGNPENEIFAVTDSDTSQVTCQGGEACPRTIGFWRQQAQQRDNGSTKICLAGMKNLWECVIDATGVIEWTGSDIKFGVSLTEDVKKLPEGDIVKGQLFQWFEAQLNGPRPMTIRDMCEVQYIGLMLNVCSGALPGSTPLSGSGGYSGTVAGAIEGIENALNGSGDIGHWKDVADAINNRMGVMAEACADENEVMRNVSPCGDGVLGTASLVARVTLNAFPNPVLSAQRANIQFNVPPQYADSKVEINLFDVSGRLVRKLVDEPRPAGLQSAHWDLRNDSGQQITAGIYFTRLKIGQEQRIVRLMVLSQD